MDIPFIGSLGAVGAFFMEDPYLYAFLAMVVAGESALLPVMFLASRGTLDMSYVLTLGVLSTIVSDSAWYWLGRKFPASVYARFTGKRTETVMLQLEHVFKTRGTQVLVLSKFVYGTKVASQILSGIHRMPYRRFIVANCLGVLLFMGLLACIGIFVDGTVEQLGSAVHTAGIVFLVFLILVVTAHVVVGRMLKRRWFNGE